MSNSTNIVFQFLMDRLLPVLISFPGATAPRREVPTETAEMKDNAPTTSQTANQGNKRKLSKVYEITDDVEEVSYAERAAERLWAITHDAHHWPAPRNTLSPHSLRFLNRHQQKKRRPKEHLNDFDIYNQEKKKLLEPKGKVSSKSRCKKSREESSSPRKAVKRAREEDLEASEDSPFNVGPKKVRVEIPVLVGESDARLVEADNVKVFKAGNSKFDEMAESSIISAVPVSNVLPATTSTAAPPATYAMVVDEKKGKRGKKAPPSMLVNYDDPFNTHCERMDVKQSDALDLNFDKLLSNDDLGEFYTLALSKVGNLYKPVSFNSSLPIKTSSPQDCTEPMDLDTANFNNGEPNDDMDCDWDADFNDDGDEAADYDDNTTMKMESGSCNALSSFDSIDDDMDLIISRQIFSFQ